MIFRNRHIVGFMLLELLIALSIGAMILVIAGQVYATVDRAQLRALSITEQHLQVDAAFEIFSHDLMQLQETSTDQPSSIITRQSSAPHKSPFIRLYKQGNDTQQSLLQIDYFVFIDIDNQQYWIRRIEQISPKYNTHIQSESKNTNTPRWQVLLDDIDEIQLRWFVAGKWATQHPPKDIVSAQLLEINIKQSISGQTVNSKYIYELPRSTNLPLDVSP